MGNGAFGVLEPARVFVISRLLVFAYFQDTEHATHLDRPERSLARHHGSGVVRERHFHFRHVRHASLAHHHVVGDEVANLLSHPPVVHANQGGDVVAHGIHRVVALVAVECPVPLFIGKKLNLAHLPHGNVRGDFIQTGALGGGPPICAGHEKLVSMQMNRVVGHREISNADAHLVIEPHIERVDTGEDAAVPRPQIEVKHRHDFWRVTARVDVEGIEQEAEVALDLVDKRVLGFGVRDPKAHHPHRHLRHLIRMRVVHEGAWPPRHELIHERLARGNGWLVQTGHAVHAVGQALAVPVDAGVFGQLVGDVDADTVAFDDLDGGTRALAVVPPQVGTESGCHFSHHGLCDQMEFLDPLVHPPRQGPAVECDDRVVRSTGIGDQRRAGLC